MRFLLVIGFLFTSIQVQAQTFGWGVQADGTLSSRYGSNVDVNGNYSIGFGLDPTLPTTITAPNTMAIMGGNVGVGTTAPATEMDVSGTIKISDGGQTCDATHEGAIRYNSTDTAIEYCNSTGWVQLTGTVDSSGTPPVWPAGTGYFVLTNSTYDGNLGGLDGADAKCLTDLTDNTWLNKGSATIDSTHVKAFLCDSSLCRGLLPSTTYTFAHSGSATDGGATFTTDASGFGPQNNQNWSAVNYLGLNVGYWTNRRESSGSLWTNTRESSLAASNCNNWISNSNGYSGYSGISNNTGSYRWNSASGGQVTCDLTQRLICFVDP